MHITNGSLLFFALLGSGIAYYFLRNMFDTISILLKTGGNIILMNLFTVITAYIIFLTCSAVIITIVVFGFIQDEIKKDILSSICVLFYGWTQTFFMYLFDIFTSSLVTGTVIKVTPRNKNEKEMNITGHAVTNTLGGMGTAAFASMIMGMLQMLKNAAENNGYSSFEGWETIIIRSILSCFLRSLEILISAVNKFVMCYTAITGTGFIKSITESWGCIKEGGFIALGAYYAVEYVLLFFVFLKFLIITGINMGYFGSYMETETMDITIMIMSIIVTFFLTAYFARIISSATNTLAFIFVLDKERINLYNAELYSALESIARKPMKENNDKNKLMN